MLRFLRSLILLSVVAARAEESIWKDNKLTAAQPFPGRVIAVESGWGGYRLVLESIGESEKEYCVAQVWPGGWPRLDYKILKKDELPQASVTTVFLNPAIEVDRFSWSMGPWKIGKVFGDEDCLKKVVVTANRQGAHAARSGAGTASDAVPTFISQSGQIVVVDESPTNAAKLKQLYDHYTGSKFEDIARELAKRVGENPDRFSGYISPEKVAAPWTYSLSLTLSEAWEYHTDYAARKEPLGAKFGVLMSVLEDSKVGPGRNWALHEISNRLDWRSQPVTGDESLPPMEDTIRRLRAIVFKDAEDLELRLEVVPVLYRHGDPNEYLDLAIGLTALAVEPHRMAATFSSATPADCADRLTKANRAKYLNHGFKLLEQIDDKKSGAGYFLAGHLGSVAGIKPVRDGQGAFSPDQRLPEYEGESGLSESFFQETVDNAMAWWVKHKAEYQVEHDGGGQPANRSASE